MFIDPVVDVFVDPCDPSFRKPEQREKEKFVEWTQRYLDHPDSHFRSLQSDGSSGYALNHDSEGHEFITR